MDPTGRRDEAPPPLTGAGPRSHEYSGDVLLSQGESPQVPSALAGLTAVFGMGTGVAPPPWSPEIMLRADAAPSSVRDDGTSIRPRAAPKGAVP